MAMVMQKTKLRKRLRVGTIGLLRQRREAPVLRHSWRPGLQRRRLQQLQWQPAPALLCPHPSLSQQLRTTRAVEAARAQQSAARTAAVAASCCPAIDEGRESMRAGALSAAAARGAAVSAACVTLCSGTQWPGVGQSNAKAAAAARGITCTSDGVNVSD
jgi:hypothetical protein